MPGIGLGIALPFKRGGISWPAYWSSLISAKKIICITTGEIFNYAKLASQKYRVDLSSIIKCCKGKLKTAGKLKFEYLPAGWKKL